MANSKRRAPRATKPEAAGESGAIADDVANRARAKVGAAISAHAVEGPRHLSAEPLPQASGAQAGGPRHLSPESRHPSPSTPAVPASSLASPAPNVQESEPGTDADSTANRTRTGGPRHPSSDLAAPASLALSITTLPTWLTSRDFPQLVQGLDHFVLQVHSFDPPKNVSAPNTLCDAARVEGWVRAASRCRVPFWVALPTYGYVAVFAPDGSFRQILAENAPSSLNPAPGVTVRTVRADPAALAGLVGRLTKRHPSECRGIVWFRLPVAADRLNWSWPTLAAVMQGRAPHAQYAAELRRPQPDLYELWLSDTGDDNTAERVRAQLVWPGRHLVAADGLNGFAVTAGDAASVPEGSRSESSANAPQPKRGPEALAQTRNAARPQPAGASEGRLTESLPTDAARVEGPAPQPGRPVLAGWFRFAPVGAEATSVTVRFVKPLFEKSNHS